MMMAIVIVDVGAVVRVVRGIRPADRCHGTRDRVAQIGANKRVTRDELLERVRAWKASGLDAACG